MGVVERPASGVLIGAPHREEVQGLTGLRFLAAFAVLVAHSSAVLMPGQEASIGIVYWLRVSSGFGMTLFFVLSGFVIHYNYATLVTDGGFRGILTFLWARFARLYPLFILILLVCTALSIRSTFSIRQLHFLPDYREQLYSIFRALPYFLLSIQSWFYVPIGANSLIYSIPAGGAPLTWSISTEWFFYLAYPCIAWIIIRARTSWAIAVLIVLWCALWVAISSGLYDRSSRIDAWAVARFGSIAGEQEHFQDSFVRWLLYFSPYLRIGEFVLGTLVAQLYVHLRSYKVTGRENAVGSALLAGAVLSVILVTFFEYSPSVATNIFRKMNLNFALAPSVALLIFCVARYRNMASQMLMTRPVIVLGDASYSIYLVHFGVLTYVALIARSADGVVFDLARLAIAVTLIILISILLYRHYEYPARKWLRHLGRGNGRQAIIAAPK